MLGSIIGSYTDLITGSPLAFSALTQRLDSDSEAAWGVHDKALEMQRQGQDVILLCVGDPDFRTPDPIIDNAVSYLCVGRTHYSPALGEITLRRAVADLESRTSPHPGDKDEVVILRLVRINTLFQLSEQYRQPWVLPAFPYWLFYI